MVKRSMPVSGELFPEERTPSIPSPSQAQEYLLSRKHQRVHHEMGRRTMMIDDFVVLDTPETSNKVLERYLKRSIINQDEAIEAIIDAMDRNAVRLDDDVRPLATLAFLGPTGVGKSQTAKALAEFISAESPRLVKIDCSNYSHGHEVAGLIGSPPGYVGHDQKPFLNKKKVERYGTVVLFDEIEKGSPALFNLMLQILGDGELQLNDGTTTSFRNTTIILTSNLGAKEMNEQLSENPVGFGVRSQEPDQKMLQKTATTAFKNFFPPEFINRLDAMVVFNPLEREGLERVLDIKLQEVNEEYSEKYGMAISLTNATYDYLVDKALEERDMGARPLVRAFEKDIQATFGRYVKNGMVTQGAHVHVYHRDELSELHKERLPEDRQLVFSWKLDDGLWEMRERRVRAEEEERRRVREEQEREEARKRAEQLLFEDGNGDTDKESPER